jgi:hypothetical protein
VVRKVRQHPDDHEFESQQWQWIYFLFWFVVYCERWYNKVTIQWKFFGYSKWRPFYRFNISNPNNFQVFVDFMLKFYQLALWTWIKHRIVKYWKKKSALNVQNRPRLQVGVSAWLWFSVGVVWCIPIFSLHVWVHETICIVIWSYHYAGQS